MTEPSHGVAENRRRLRVAIACPGVGVVQRGFERFFTDLFGVLRQDFEVTLFKGGGPPSESEKVLPFVRRGGRLVKVLPVHRLVGRSPLHTECMTFALAMMPYLRNGAFDLVHTIDPPLTRLLFHLRSTFGMRFRLLYTEGTAMPPSDYPPADHIQQVALTTLEEAAAFGHARERMSLIPCGFHPERFAVAQTRAELRRAYGLDENTFVILAVSAINRGHKRTHHLIDEAARLQGDFLLWLDGSLDHGDPELVDYARQRLGDRCRITHVSSDRVGELYRLADVMPHAATFEAFGLALVEAAGCGLPVLIHDAPHFRWLLPRPDSWIDMTKEGALAERLACLMQDRARLSALRQPESALRFAWETLRPQYRELYQAVSAGPASPQKFGLAHG